MGQLGKLEQLQAVNQQLMEAQQENERCLRLNMTYAEKHMRKVERQRQEKMRWYTQKTETYLKEQMCQAAEEKRRMLKRIRLQTAYRSVDRCQDRMLGWVSIFVL